MSAGFQFCLVFLPIVSVAYLGYLQSKLNSVAGAPALAAVPVTA